MSVERVDIEGIIAGIRGDTPEINTPRRSDLGETSPVERALELRRTLAELTDCCDLYATRGMPPTRLWIPRPIRWFLVRAIRYVLNWQTHWNLTAARALDEMLRRMELVERRAQTKATPVEKQLGGSDAERDLATAPGRLLDASRAAARDPLAADVRIFARVFADDRASLERGSRDEILRLFEVVARSLRPGAVCLFETATAEAGVVSIAESLGLEVLEVHDSRSAPEDQRLQMVPGDDATIRVLNENFARLNRLLFGATGCAVVCRKPGGAPNTADDS